MKPWSPLQITGMAAQFRRLAELLMQESGRGFRDSGVKISPRCFPVYCHLHRAGPGAVMDIARALGVTHPTVIQVAAELIDQELVTHYRDRKDKRKRVLALTMKGKALLPVLESSLQEVSDALQDHLQGGGADFLDHLAGIESALRARGRGTA